MKKTTRIGIGGPVGSGKTALVEAITPLLIDRGAKVLIVTNDVVTTEDAKHVQRTLKGILMEERILGVETGACPHTAVREDPSMNLAAVEDMEARFPDTDVVLIESGGDNLTLTFSPALVDFFVYVIDVAAGDKIPARTARASRSRTSWSSTRPTSRRMSAPASRSWSMTRPSCATASRSCSPTAGRAKASPNSCACWSTTSCSTCREHRHRAPWPALGRAPELAAYQDEPRQMRSAVVGKSGALRLGFERRGARTALVTMERRVPLLVQRPLYWDRSLPGMACVSIIHTSGSVLGGDRSHVRIDVGPGAQAYVTTQAATKIHEMDANYAAQVQDIALDHGAYLEYLPGVTIPHRHSRYLADTRVTLPGDATMLLSEIVMPGRTHHGEGERFAYDVYSSTVSAERPDGERLFTEKILVEPAAWSVREAGAMGGYDVFGTLFALTGREHATAILEATTPSVDAARGVASGASRLPHDAGVIFRVLGTGSAPVRRRIREFRAVVRQQVLGTSLPEAFLWE